MLDFSPLFNHIAPHITLTDQEKQVFTSVLILKKVKRRQLLDQPGYISRHRSFVVEGAFRAFFMDANAQQHTIALAIDNWFIGDPAGFFLQEPATLYVEALEDSTLIQWSYESEQLLLEKIPSFTRVMMQRSQQIALMLQRRLISHVSLSAEERYEEFVQNYPSLVQRMPLYMIASYLGMSREFLSKIRQQRMTITIGSKAR